MKNEEIITWNSRPWQKNKSWTLSVIIMINQGKEKW